MISQKGDLVFSWLVATMNCKKSIQRKAPHESSKSKKKYQFSQKVCIFYAIIPRHGATAQLFGTREI